MTNHKHSINCISEGPSGAYCNVQGSVLIFDDPRTPYRMTGRGQTYMLTPEGHIKRTDMAHSPSSSWVVVAVVPRWNSRPQYGTNDWPALKSELDAGKTISGYLYDRDHGTLRMWGGIYGGKVPKVTIRKVG